ncbi:MAG TPA: cupin domain-containing protein [Vicinamibacterales bacterium]|nr:cupin domain-containing protein [Vicinamibacterales bacterium]
MPTLWRREIIWAGLALLGIFCIGVRARAAQDALPSGLFDYAQLAVRASGPTEIRQMFTGTTHSGYRVDLHATDLAAGQMPHPPHRHVHEELLLIREGTLEVTVKGRTQRLGPGSAVYIASNDEHGWKNVGSAPAKYLVMALGDDK